MPRWKTWHARVFQVAVVTALLVLLLLLVTHRGPRLTQLSGSTMGTTYTVKFVADPSGFGPQDERAIGEAVTDSLAGINQGMSTYLKDSELSRFNTHPDDTPFRVSEHTFRVFELALQISELTGGAFDITVGPIVNAYGFGPEPRRAQAPTDSELAGLRRRVGYRLIEIDPDTQTIRKSRPDVYCDLSAIAKGYAVDRVAEILEERNIQDYMVEIGGEVRARGKNAECKPWQIGLEEPITDGRGIYRVIGLVDQSLATSGDYRNYYVRDGVRISHTIDPRTARPVTHRLASVTVIHEECAQADALATALMVLGPEQGYNLAESEGIAALLLVRQEDGAITERATSAFIAATQATASKPQAAASRE